MDNMDVYAVFGLEAPAEEPAAQETAGEQEQEVADPADTGEQEQEVADPDTLEADAEDELEQPVQEPAADKAPLTKAQKAAQARQRREQEKQQAVEAALAKERQAQNARLEAFFAQAKMTDPYNGGTIKTLEDAEKWAASNQAAAVERNLKAGKLTQEDLQQMIENSPSMQKAREISERADREAQESQRVRFAQQVQQELAQIRKMDPSIQSLNDIIRLPTGKRFAELVEKHGLSYEDAFRLANMDRLQKQTAAAAAAGAKVSAGGKDHLTKTGMRGKGSAEVSREEAAAYRVFQPGMTDDQIQKDYAKRVRSV